jgi:uncharacterized protein (DUF2141 family)
MLKISQFTLLMFATLASIIPGQVVNALPTQSLTIVVNGIQNKTGQICMGIYNQEKGFPDNTSNLAGSACVNIKGNILKHKFVGLKPGNYAVAIVDDQNGDRQLNKDFFGIPTEGFGISNNPTVSIQTGTPNFAKAKFLLDKNTTINITVKYSLDP